MTVNISSKSRYAVRALAELAALEAEGRDRAVPLGEIAERREIPQQFLEQVFATLRRSRIVRSRRGANGGYRFARPPADGHRTRRGHRARRGAVAGRLH